jgi:SagB-type dehydrogenase family enzyme
MALTESLAGRRSCRELTSTPLSLENVSQLCWAAQGVTHRDGLRAAPSAGALYRLTLLVLDAQGVHEYQSQGHALISRALDDIRASLQREALDQPCVGAAPVCFAIVMQIKRLAVRYGERSLQYGLLEAGHVAQNLLLQATALGLSGVPVGAFDDRRVDAALGLASGIRTVYLIPVGFPVTK